MSPALPSQSARHSASIAVATAMLASVAHAQTPAPGDRPGPWDNDVVLTHVGTDGAYTTRHTFPRAGVPTLARLGDGRLIAAFQNFPSDDERNFDRVAVAFSSDSGVTWTAPQAIEVPGMDEGLARPFDPTLLPLPDGRMRLYFTSNSSPDFRKSTPAIYSAISADGLHYQFEPGVRFAVEGQVVIDCAATLHNGVFHLFVPINGTPEEARQKMERGGPPTPGGAYHAISTDGLSFERQPDISANGQGKFLGCAISRGEWMYFFGSGQSSWPLRSRDGADWEQPRIAMQIPGADPGAVRLDDGSWLVLATTGPREGTASSRRMGRGGGRQPNQPGQPPQPQGPGQPPTPGQRPRIAQGNLEVGKPAPDFTLSDADGKNPVTLSKLQGKPTVLVFGSCTCPPFVRSTEAVNDLYERFHDRVNFVMVYIREAHPTDEGSIPGNQFKVESPKTLDERCTLARDFDRRIGIDLPLVVDTIDDATSRLYSPWPNRMVIVDAQGRIAHAGEAGPQGTTESAAHAPEMLDPLLEK